MENDGDAVRQGLVASLPVLRRYARKLYRHRATDAADLVQSTVERALAKSHLWCPGTNLNSWLLSVMHSLFINQLRREARRVIVYGEFLDKVSGPGAASVQVVLVVRDLRRAMAEMDARHPGTSFRWSQIIMRIARGDSYEQVARDLGIPLGTVRSSLSRARDDLRIIMDRGPRSPLS